MEELLIINYHKSCVLGNNEFKVKFKHHRDHYKGMTKFNVINIFKFLKAYF